MTICLYSSWAMTRPGQRLCCVLNFRMQLRIWASLSRVEVWRVDGSGDDDGRGTARATAPTPMLFKNERRFISNRQCDDFIIMPLWCATTAEVIRIRHRV